VEWLKVKALSSSPSTAKKKIKKINKNKKTNTLARREPRYRLSEQKIYSMKLQQKISQI
jgi:hypothetical protein